MQNDKTYSEILKQLSLGAREVVFDYDCSDTVMKEFGRIMAEHPELFWLTGSCKYSKSVRGNEVKVTLIPEIMIDDEELKRRRQRFDQDTRRRFRPSRRNSGSKRAACRASSWTAAALTSGTTCMSTVSPTTST